MGESVEIKIANETEYFEKIESSKFKAINDVSSSFNLRIYKAKLKPRDTDVKNIKNGDFIILFNEVLCRKIEKDLYEVYDGLSIRQITQFVVIVTSIEKEEEREKNLSILFQQTVVSCVDKSDRDKKFLKTSKGTRRNKFWESKSYF